MGEVEYLRKMMESLKRMVTGQGLEETSGETGDRVATLEEAEEREKCVGREEDMFRNANPRNLFIQEEPG